MQEHFDLQAHNTFGLSVRARYFCAASTVPELRDALQFAHRHNLPAMILGGGSNVLFCEDYPGVVVHVASRGIEVVGESAESTDDYVMVRAAGGENWHALVEHCLHAGYHGLENLALIPGCVGAAPIQNIGAYGVEVKDVITHVEILDMITGSIDTLTCEQCELGYRDSIFKRGFRARKVILAVTFRLHRKPEVNLRYAALSQALADVADPGPQQVFDAVCTIRRSKLPDPAVLGNAGSFFKNPVISKEKYDEISRSWPGLPSFPAARDEAASTVNVPPPDEVKVPAAWLIEHAGWKGRSFGQAGVYRNQPLVLVNLGNASAVEILELAKQVMTSVEQQFDILLEPEVQWIPPQFQV